MAWFSVVRAQSGRARAKSERVHAFESLGDLVRRAACAATPELCTSIQPEDSRINPLMYLDDVFGQTRQKAKNENGRTFIRPFSSSPLGLQVSVGARYANAQRKEKPA